MDIQSTSTELSEASTMITISVEDFVPNKCLEMINSWLEGHQLAPVDSDHLPDTGFLLREDGDILGCVFLYQPAKRLGWIEGCLSNPIYPKGKVAEHFMFALDYIEIRAREMGINKLIVSTFLPEHSKKFKESGYSRKEKRIVLTKELM